MDAWSGGSATGSVARGHNFVIANGSCFQLVKALPDASVDLVCIDPPYTQGSAAPRDPKVCSYENVAWSAMSLLVCHVLRLRTAFLASRSGLSGRV